MNTIGVNISANKTFADAAEELLTRNSQSVHDLCTELLASSAIYQGRAKNAQQRSAIRLSCDTFIRCLIAGWTAAMKEAVTAPRSIEPKTGTPRIDNLADPFCSRGFHIAIGQIQTILSKGHHKSQGRHAEAAREKLLDGTKRDEPPSAPKEPQA